jgi:hypothetical protein
MRKTGKVKKQIKMLL